MPSTPYTIRHITSATDAEIAALTAVLVEAFQGDPFSKILLAGDLSLAPAELRANVRAALLGGAVHALALGPRAEDICGVAVWYPPGKSLFATPEERAAGWDEFLASVPASLRDWWTDYFGPTMGRLTADALGASYGLHAWHLHLFGVRPAHQGRGYGRALFEHAERQANAARAPMIVETTTEVDVKIYTKLGFRIVGGTDITSEVGTAHVWLMVKDSSLGMQA